MLNFGFLEKGLKIASPPHFVYKENCLSCYVLLTDQILFPDCLYFLRYCTICELQFFVINCEINLIFLIKPFLIIDKFAIIHSRLSSRFSSRLRSQDKNILRIKRAFKVTWNKFSIIFQELLLAKSCLRLESALLKRPSVHAHSFSIHHVTILVTLASRYTRIPSLIIFAHAMFYWFFTAKLTFTIIPFFAFSYFFTVKFTPSST